MTLKRIMLIKHFVSINDIKTKMSRLKLNLVKYTKSILGFKYELANEIDRLIIDCAISFVSVIISTIMRMGVGIFEYSLISLILNSVIYSIAICATFLYLKINKTSWYYFAIPQINKLLLGVVLAGFLTYPLMMVMDRMGFLSSSIMFINVFVSICLLLIPRLLCKHKVVNQASDIFVVEQSDGMCPKFTNMIYACDFKPMGIVVAGDKNECDKVVDSCEDGSVPVLGSLSEISKIISLLRTQKIIPRRLVIINPIASDEFEFLKKYTTQNGIILLQVFNTYTVDTKLAD